MAQPIRTATGQPYGAAKQQADAQRAAPLAGGGSTSWEAPIIPLDAPTNRPGEPVTDGVNVGPGRNAAQAGVPGAMGDTTRDGILNTLRGIYEAFPLDEIRDLIVDFADNPPWTIEDLFLPSPGDMLNTAKDLANKIPHPDMRPSGFQVFPNKTGNGPPVAGAGGPMFDPTAELDPTQVQDNRPPDAVMAGLGAAAAAGSDPTTGVGDPMSTWAESDLATKRQGAQ